MTSFEIIGIISLCIGCHLIIQSKIVEGNSILRLCVSVSVMYVAKIIQTFEYFASWSHRPSSTDLSALFFLFTNCRGRHSLFLHLLTRKSWWSCPGLPLFSTYHANWPNVWSAQEICATLSEFPVVDKVWFAPFCVYISNSAYYSISPHIDIYYADLDAWYWASFWGKNYVSLAFCSMSKIQLILTSVFLWTI
jgi:hypothetical protein